MQATPEQVRRITENVLARQEFSEKLTWSQMLMDRILRWFDALIDWSARNPGLAKLLTYVLGLVLIVLIAHIANTVVREFVSLRKTDGGKASRQPLRALEGVAQNWSEAFHLAKAALDSGDLYRALWITHRILLSVLDRMGRIKFVRWKTNSDYLRECTNDGTIGSTLSELTVAYERVIYAHTDYDRQQAVKLLAAVEALAAEAGR